MKPRRPASRILSGPWWMSSRREPPPSWPTTLRLGDKLQIIAGKAPVYLLLFDRLADQILRRLDG